MSFPWEEGKLFKCVPRVCQEKDFVDHAFLNHNCLAVSASHSNCSRSVGKDSNNNLCHDLSQAPPGAGERFF